MQCSRCGSERPRSEFGPSAERWPSQRECHACARGRQQRRRHGLIASERQQIADHQGGCAICGHAEPGGHGWVIDHDRSCCDGDASCPKCRRGVVCHWCNSMLGYAFDRIATLRAAITYLEQRTATEGCEWHMPVACAPGICGEQMHGRNGRDGLTHVVVTPADHIALRNAQEEAR